MRKKSINDKYIDMKSKGPFQKKVKPLSFKDKCLLSFGLLILLPVRTFLFFIIILLGWFISRVGLLGLDESRPATGFVRMLQQINYSLFRIIIRVCFGFFCPKVKGTFLPANEVPVVVVAPHTSFFDAWVVAWIARQGFCSSLVREESQKSLFLGPILRFQQYLFVRRSSESSRAETVKSILERSSDKDWGRLVIFPEGTTTDGTELLPFKKGGFLAERVHPVLVRYPNRVDCTTWARGEGVKFAIMDTVMAMATLYNRAEMEILPALEAKEGPEEFSDRTRRVMGEQLGISVVDDNNSQV